MLGTVPRFVSLSFFSRLEAGQLPTRHRRRPRFGAATHKRIVVRPPGCIDDAGHHVCQIIVAMRSVVDRVLAGAGDATLEADDLRHQPIVTRQRDPTRILRSGVLRAASSRSASSRWARKKSAYARSAASRSAVSRAMRWAASRWSCAKTAAARQNNYPRAAATDDQYAAPVSAHMGWADTAIVGRHHLGMPGRLRRNSCAGLPLADQLCKKTADRRVSKR